MGARAVRVVTEVAAVDRPFDYALGEGFERTSVGDRVRVDFNHRSVRGWVVEEVDAREDLKPLTKWLGYGPPASLLGLLTWASTRWYGQFSRFLKAASPTRLVTSLPVAPAAAPLAATVSRLALAPPPGVIQVSPTTDPLPLVLSVYEATRQSGGSLLVLVPTEAWATRLRGRLEQRGCAVASRETEWDRMRAGWPVVVGSRGAALAPVPTVGAAVVIDADDELFRSESAPTWDSVTMLKERCRRDGAPLWCTSMIPSPSLTAGQTCGVESDVTHGWPRVTVIDRRLSDPHDGVLSRDALASAHRSLLGSEPIAVAVVLQRLGTGRLFVCPRCGELARCAQCAQPEQESGESLACVDGHSPRANFCRSCGAVNLKRVRVGVTTLARDVAAQLAQPVSEVTAKTPANESLHRVVVGTEAIWQRVRRCSTVIFVDFDQYLLAPRESARRDAATAVGKAGRLVGSRREGRGEVVLQTRRREDVVVTSVLRGDVTPIIEEDVETARLLGLAPFGALANLSGEGAAEFVQVLHDPGLTVSETASGFTLRAPNVESLTGALAQAPRPTGRLRVAVQ